MLAYSSIAHAGYLLVGLVAASAAGKAAILFYLVAYASRTSARSACSRRSRRPTVRTTTSGTSPGCRHERPGLAALLTVFLLSLGGFPPTVGFVAKWYIFNAAVQEDLIALAVLGVLTSVVSVFFYLRIVVQMYMTDERAPGHRPALTRSPPSGSRSRSWPCSISACCRAAAVDRGRVGRVDLLTYVGHVGL